MVFKAMQGIVRRAESAAAGGIEAVLNILRELPALDFGMLQLTLPDSALPNLSAVLPRAAPDDIQRKWTGSTGYDCLRDAKEFILRLQLYSYMFRNKGIEGATIMDFGVGFGRMARLIPYYTDPCNFYGLDPLQESIDLCRNYGVLGNIIKSEYLPVDLPVGSRTFDLVYAYSVFTHTSEAATRAALNAIRKHMSPKGLLVVTVRPIEIWDLPEFGELENVDRHQKRHDFLGTGFAFEGSKSMPEYGVTTISPEWLRANAIGWKLVHEDRSDDHLQFIIVLQSE